MNLSKAISSLSLSPTVALNTKAKSLKDQGIDVLNFAVGEPDFSTPEAIVDVAITALREGHTGYGPAGGTNVFRSAIARKLESENGLNFAPENIVCGIGAKEILFHTFLAILDPGDEVLLSAPCWVSYAQQIQAVGAKPVIIPVGENLSALYPSIEVIESYASPKTRAFVLCSPNNPAGYCIPQPYLEELGTYLTKKDWWVISDEIYEYLTFDDQHHSIGALCPYLGDRFVHVSGMSKGFAMTGWRVGYMAGPSSLVKLVKSLQSHSSTCIPPFIEEAATWAIGQGRQLMQQEIVSMRERRDLAVACLRRIPALRWIYPQGAFYVFIDVREILEQSPKFDSGDSLKMCETLLEEYHLAFVPGEAFEAPGFFRFSYATDRETIESGFSRLGQAISEFV